MRSYTNREGEVINVSKEHLEIAIKIKKELQESSPSRKCNWKLHKELMKKEGFDDSDKNESYRCLIKNYQKSIGKLPEAPKYADMVADGKLESIKELVGEIAYEKREAQHEFRKLNKVKRDIIDFTLIAEQIGNAFREHDFSKIKFNYQPLKNTNKKMIVCLSDLHIGALIDNEFNTYNFEIATKRMEEYMSKVLHECESNGIREVYVMNLGDVIEHPYMHNLAYSCEFTLSEQIAMTSDLIIKFLIGLSEKVEVTVAGIAGNHDRLNENKNANLDGDHAVKGVNKAIQSFIQNAKAKRIKYEQALDYEHSIELNGRKFKFIHGDLDGINDLNILAKHSSLDGIDYDMIIMGHYHHFKLVELGFDKFMACFGALKGADNYAVKNRKLSAPSQGIVIVDENGEIEVKRVKLAS